MHPESIQFTKAEHVNLSWYTEEREEVGLVSVYHGVRLRGRVVLVHTHWAMTTVSAEAGIACGGLVEGADYTVFGELPDSEHVWIMVAAMRTAQCGLYQRARTLLAALRSARPGWIAEGHYCYESNLLWIKLAGNKRFYNWEELGYFSSTVTSFANLEDFMQCTLDPRARDVSDLVSINLRALLGELQLSKAPKMRYARRVIKPKGEVVPPVVVVPPVAAPAPMEPAAYPTMSEPVSQPVALAGPAQERDLPRAGWVLAPDGSGYEDPNDSSTWIVPASVQRMAEEGRVEAERKAAPYVMETFEPKPELEQQMLANIAASRAQRAEWEAADAKAAEASAQPKPLPTFWP